LENEAELPAADSPEALAGFKYPPELDLQRMIPQFREMARSEEGEPDTDSTQFITRKQVDPTAAAATAAQAAPPAKAAAAETENCAAPGEETASRKPGMPPMRKPFSMTTPQPRQPTLGWRGLKPQVRMALG